MIREATHHTVTFRDESHKALWWDALCSGMSISTADFICAVADDLLIADLSATDLANKHCERTGISMTPGAVIYHLRILKQKKYVIRSGHRSWSIGDIPLEIKNKYRKQLALDKANYKRILQ